MGFHPTTYQIMLPIATKGCLKQKIENKPNINNIFSVSFADLFNYLLKWPKLTNLAWILIEQLEHKQKLIGTRCISAVWVFRAMPYSKKTQFYNITMACYYLALILFFYFSAFHSCKNHPPPSSCLPQRKCILTSFLLVT